MSDNHDDTENNHDLSTPALDHIAAALALCDLAAELHDLAINHKVYKGRLRQRAKLERDIAAGEQKRMALTAEAEQKETALAAREAAIAAREAAIDVRETEFAASIEEARDNLHGYYNSLAETDRHIRHRILSSAGLLSGYHPQLQDLPTWDQLKRLVVGLPDDPPPIEREVARPRIDVFSDTSDDPHADRQGAPFLGEVTRDVTHKRKSAA